MTFKYDYFNTLVRVGILFHIIRPHPGLTNFVKFDKMGLEFRVKTEPLTYKPDIKYHIIGLQNASSNLVKFDTLLSFTFNIKSFFTDLYKL